MKHTAAGKWLKIVVIFVGMCGLLVYGWGLPNIFAVICKAYPQFTSWRTPWLTFLWVTAIPCYGVLVCTWKIARNIGRGAAFSYDNGNQLKRIARFAAADAAFLFVGNIVFGICGMNRVAMACASLVVVTLGVAIAVCAKAMAQLVYQAADIQEENNGTI